MKLVIAATPKVAIPAIEELKRKHQISIVTQPDRPAGRGKALTPTEISQEYPEALKPETDEELASILKDCDLFITIGFGRLLPEEVLNIPRFGGINLHFSLLPKWRGAAPVQRAIEAGDKLTGVTVFQMDSGMDSGPIWEQIEYPISYGMDSPKLFDALSEIGKDALQIAITRIIKGESPRKQSGEITFAKKVLKSECVIDWSNDAETIIRKIRAFGFNPGITARIRNEQIKVEDARVSNVVLPTAQLNSNCEVGTGRGSITLLRVTPAGKRSMTAQEWINGFKPKDGECFD